MHCLLPAKRGATLVSCSSLHMQDSMQDGHSNGPSLISLSTTHLPILILTKTRQRLIESLLKSLEVYFIFVHQMATVTETASDEGTYKLELRTAYGPVYRDVRRTPPRDCEPSEVPVIDISSLYGDLPARQALAATIREAAENTGFFYIKNHGIPDTVIDAALHQAKTFFAQPDEQKRKVSTALSSFFNGWVERHGTAASPTEGRDHREGFSWRYDPRYDPERAGEAEEDIPPSVRAWIRGEELVWEGTSHLPGFKEDVLAYWRACLSLSRRLLRVFALALGLPEGYFDGIVTYPGADGVFNYYPRCEEPEAADVDVGLGAHTDLQSFTLLWQDAVGGLQVLRRDGQWIRVPPVEGTFVVNIGDYLMRLSNDRFQSTVHRVFNRAPVDRYSMPFFFGFNFDESCGVLPTCTSEDNPPKYEPITCGEVSLPARALLRSILNILLTASEQWCRLRLEQGTKKRAS